MKYIVFIFIFCCGCYSQQKAKNQFNKAALNYPIIPAEYCANTFPSQDSIIVRDSVRRDTILELNFFTDTVTTDSIVYVRRDSVILRTITNTKIKDSIVYRSNTAEEKRLQLALKACQDNNNQVMEKYLAQIDESNQWKGKARKRFWLLIFLAGVGAAYTAIKIKKSFLT